MLACDQAPRGVCGVSLAYTDGNDRARTFYRRHGFVEDRRDPPERLGWPDRIWMLHPLG